MKLLSVFLLCLSQALAMSVVSYDGYSVLRVDVPDRSAADRLHELEDSVEFWSDLPGKHADIMVSPENLVQITTRLENGGFKYSTMIKNVAELIKLEKIEAPTTIKENADHPMTWTKYHSLEDIHAYLDYLAATYPDLASVETIGQSYEGHDMKLLKICKGGCGNKPAMWIDGGIHAREWISPATVTFMMRQLVEVQDPEEADLLENLDWYILSNVNPDGYEHSRNSDRLWRKTRSQNSGGICKGTDANRNYGFHWDEGGSSDSGCSDTFHGSEAFSEVENRNIRDFILPRKDQIKFFNSIHSFSQLILLPWGFNYDPTPNYDQLFKLATTANEALEAVHGKKYDVGCIPCLLYIASGGSMDWALGEAGIPYSMGMELRDTGVYGFLLPPEQIVPTGEETWAFHKSAGRQIVEEFGARL